MANQHRREDEVCEVELLNVPFKVLFPPHHLREAKPGELEPPPYEEKLNISVWIRYQTPDYLITHNWDWVPLEQWLEAEDGRELASDGTLEELRNLVTARALKEPFEQGLKIHEIKVDIMRTTEGIRSLEHVSADNSSVRKAFGNLAEAAIITHTIEDPLPSHWRYMEQPAQRGKHCPMPFAPRKSTASTST